MFKKYEMLVFMLTGKIVAVVGGVGAVITVLFDRIAGRCGAGIVMGPAQLTGLVAFISLVIFGIYADVFLNDTIKPMIEKYLDK